MLSGIAYELKIPPVLQRPSAVAREQEKHGHADIRDEVEGQQDDELGDLAERKGRIDGGARWPAQPTDRVVERVFGDGTVLSYQILVAFVYHNRVKDVDLRFVLEEVNPQSNRRGIRSLGHCLSRPGALTTRKDSNRIATTAAPSPSTRKVPLTHALPVLWNRARKATCGRNVQKKRFRRIKALRRKAGSRRAFSNG